MNPKGVPATRVVAMVLPEGHRGDFYLDDCFGIAPKQALAWRAAKMATVSERHPGGRPPKHKRSAMFLRVKEMARRKGLHLDELASRSGLSDTAFYKLKDPRLSTLRKLSNALGVTIDKLTRDVNLEEASQQ